MKYTPEELLEYVKSDPVLESGASLIPDHNDKGFYYYPVDPATFRKDKDAAYLTIRLDIDGEWISNDIRVVPEEAGPEVMEALERENKENVRVFLTEYQERVHLLAIAADDESGDADGDWKIMDVDDAARDELLLDFLRFTGINTRGQLKTAIARAWEIFEEHKAAEEKRRQFLDACGVEEDWT